MDIKHIQKKMKQGEDSLIKFLSTGEGQNVLFMLKGLYGGSVFVPGDPYETHRRIGEKEVYEYFLDLRDNA